jgi:collagen type III alpha
MRSTGFALLGLTAAASLALVAIFALPGFPLLAPAPLPDEPSGNESVAGAKKVAPVLASQPSVAVVVPTPSASSRDAGGARVPGSQTEPSGAPEGSGQVDTHSPLPASAPEPTPEGGGEEPSEGGPAPAPAAAPAPAPAPTSTPAETPSQPSDQSSSQGDIATATADSGPGKSKSGKDGGHDSKRGVEASSGRDDVPSGHGHSKAVSHPPSDPPSPAAPPASPPAVPGPPDQSGHDNNGNHKGHYK